MRCLRLWHNRRKHGALAVVVEEQAADLGPQRGLQEAAACGTKRGAEEVPEDEGDSRMNVEQKVKDIIVQQLGRRPGEGEARGLVRRRPRRRLARHGRAGHGLRGGVRRRDPGRRGGEDPHRRQAIDLIEHSEEHVQGGVMVAPGRRSPAWVSSSPLGSRDRGDLGRPVSGRSGVGPITHFDATALLRLASRARSRASTPTQLARARRTLKKFDLLHPVRHGRGRAGHGASSGVRRCTRRTPNESAWSSAAGSAACRGSRSSTRTLLERGPRRVSPFFIPGRSSTWRPARSRSGSAPRGPNSATWPPPARTGAHAIGDAFRYHPARRLPTP